MSRNTTCSYAREWTEAATELIGRFVSPFKTGTNGLGLRVRYYHYYASGNPRDVENDLTGPSGFLYECTETEPSEEGGGAFWDCWRPGRPPASTEYAWSVPAK